MGIDLYNLVISAKLQKGGGGGGDIDVDSLTVTENGTYSASSGHAFDPVTVSVPQGVFPSGTSSITANGIYDITNFASVDVNVSGGGGDHTAEDGLVTRNIISYENSRVTSVGAYAFGQCKSLTTVSFPNLTLVGSQAFMSCISLNSLSFPKAESIYSQAFQYCDKISEARFPRLNNLGKSAFAFCSRLISLYLTASSVASLQSANAFNSTPMSLSTFTGSFGSIYVPASLVSAYKSATNWSVYADRITSYVE